ncbi:hypothetical protein CJ030_MR7G001525 [Morella rubra]|uniref:RNase H type-1 domain-containing protein n=1 Tax=Morella rubra TaxID=262757 RepID=A0A6A1V235_9ROSI|nr:hypothetical protein CJ030_MR7G001525 [Morella rubra]
MERVQDVDPLVGETMAVVCAVELALEKRWTHALFESDSKLLCDELASERDLARKWRRCDFFPSDNPSRPSLRGLFMGASETQSTGSFTSSMGSSFEDFWF